MENYPRRPGSDDSGRDYEIRITALLSLRYISMKNTTDMWLGSNVDKIGDFDDIVFYNQNVDGISTVYMIQLKHQDSPKNITQGDFLFSAKQSLGKKKKSKADFSLSKYCESFLSLKEKIDNPTEDELEIIKHLRKVNKIIFILYTNKNVTEIEFLSKLQDVKELEFLNTSENVKENIYGFDYNNSKLNYNKDFLQQLLLFTNQVHANEADKLIKKEIKYLTGFSKTQIDYKEVTNKFLAFIKIWIKETEINTEKEYIKMHLSLRKDDIINILSDIILQPYNVNFGKDLSASAYTPWNDLLIDKSITVVDYDETVLGFLKQYIGNVVGSYSLGCKTWIEDLPKKAQDLFFKEQKNKSQMLKIVGNRNITMLDFYKYLWFINKVPLLLEIQTEEQFKIIRKILKLFQYKLKVIIINKCAESLFNITDIPKHFITLKNLNNEDRLKILNLNVCLQGKSSVLLGDLINDKLMYEYIKCKDIIHIILGDFNIGNVYEPLDENFINRSLSKIIYETKLLKQIKNDTFVIHNSGGKIGFKDFINYEEQYFDLTNEKNIILIENENYNLKFGTVPVHRLKYWYDDYLEWKESLGSTVNIRQLQVIEPTTLNKYLKHWKLPQEFDDFWVDLIKNDFFKTRIINACPGMGKSILLNFIALKSPPNTWVIKVNLNKHYDYYEKIRRCSSNFNVYDHLKYFNDLIIKDCENIKLVKAVVNKLINLKKILVLLDGFDEISISYKDEVTEIAKMLHEEGFPVWLTTRPVMKQHLEDEFDLMSNTIKPFCSEDQKNFLIKYFTGTNNITTSNKNHLEIIKKFSDKLLEAARDNLKDRGCEFTGIPLQTRLLAEAFKNDCEKSLEADVINFNDKFDLLYLYEKFIDDKNDILCGKFGFGVKEMRIFFERHQQLFALKTLFDKDDLAGLNLDEQLAEYYEDKQQKIQFLQREGVVVVEQNTTGAIEKFNVNFVHRTFAEFLAARWLSENFNNRNETIEETALILLKIRFEHSYSFPFLFNIFDRLVAKNCPLHLSVINGQIEEAERIIKTNSKALRMVDKAGRTVTHIIAQYGAYHTEDTLKIVNVKDEVINLIEYLPTNLIKNSRDNLYDYGPLDYAIASRSYAIANKLCEKSDNLDFHVPILEKDNIFTYCDFYGYKYLFKILLPYFASADLLLKQVEPNTPLETYVTLETDLSDNKNIREYAKERNVTTLLEMFESQPGYYKDIQFAAAFGTKNNVVELLSKGIDVNEDDVHDNMPIHYAAIHGRLEILKILLEEGADLEEPGEWGNTPLHYAAKFGHNKIVEELLAQGADINIQNNEDDTPLLLAIMGDNIDTAKLLLLNGAVVDTQNDLKDSALCCATEMGYLELLSLLLKNDSNMKTINIQCEMNRTLLHHALNGPWDLDCRDLEKQICIVKLLLDKGINVNLQDDLGLTALHDASNYNAQHPKANNDLKEFFEEVVLLLLNKGADPNIKDAKGRTALDLAIKNGNTKTISVLEKITNSS